MPTTPNTRTQTRQTYLSSLCVIAGMSLFIPIPGHSQAPLPTLILTANTPEICSGKPFELIVELQNARSKNKPNPDFQGFKTTEQPIEVSGFQLNSGTHTSKQKWTYTLLPAKTGNHTLGPLTLHTDKGTLQSNTIPLLVTQSTTTHKPPQFPKGQNPELFVYASLNNPTAFPGQQITYRVELYTHTALEGANLLELPEFKGCFYKEKTDISQVVKLESINGKQYAVKTLFEAGIYPMQTGEIPLNQARVNVEIAQKQPNGKPPKIKTILLASDSLTIIVNPLPNTGKHNFIGAVGQYSLFSQTNRQKLYTRENFKLTLRIKGDGDPQRLQIPRINLPTGLETYEPQTQQDLIFNNGESFIHQKTIVYTITAYKPGIFNIAPSITCLDPQTQSYYTLTADSAAIIVVLPPPDSAQATRPTNPNTQRDSNPAIQPHTHLWTYPVIIGTILTLLSLLLLLKLRGTKPSHPPGEIPAYHEFLKSADREKNAGNPRAFYDALFHHTQAYLGHKLQLPTNQINTQSIVSGLEKLNCPKEIIEKWVMLRETTEARLFTGNTESASIPWLWEAVTTNMATLEKICP
jgi:hypothetical protein